MEKQIWFTSDWHFGHNKEFLYEPRGFASVYEHAQTIIENHNKVVKPEDDVWVLGDLMLGDNEFGLDCIKQLNGNLYIVLGNHDTDCRIKLYKQLPNVKYVGYAYMLKYKKYSFFLCHYPTCQGNYGMQMSRQWCLHGHTHSKNIFSDIDKNFNVNIDAHYNYPVNIDEILRIIQSKWNEIYQSQLKSHSLDK